VTGVGITPGPVAPWRQVYELLAARIRSGELAPGDRLPSLVDMAREHGVAVSTIQKTVGQLKADGLVQTSPMGTYVAKH
jgi:GntR family transcriptional regulator